MTEQFFRHHEMRHTSAETFERYLEDYPAQRDALIEAAARDRDNAVSYRNPPFKVGSAIMSKDPNQSPGEYSIYSGHNYKPAPGPQSGIAKRCAEKQALEKALANHTEMVVAIVSVSDQISTGDSTKAHDALHPCGECRQMIRQMKREGLVNDKTVVCNVNDSRTGADGKWAREERSVDELLAMYDVEDGVAAPKSQEPAQAA